MPSPTTDLDNIGHDPIAADDEGQRRRQIQAENSSTDNEVSRTLNPVTRLDSLDNPFPDIRQRVSGNVSTEHSPSATDNDNTTQGTNNSNHQEALVPPVPTPRRRAIVDNNSFVTRNQLAFILVLMFGVISAIALLHLYKQIQTAYIVSSLIHNVPAPANQYKQSSSTGSGSSSSHPPPKLKPNASPASNDPNINPDIPNPATNTILDSKVKLSPEVEIYAQQLQRVLASLKRAIGNMDKSQNSSHIGGIIEMKPMLEEKKPSKSKIEKVPLEDNDGIETVTEVNPSDTTKTESAKIKKETMMGNIHADLLMESMGENLKEMKEAEIQSEIVGKKTAMLLNAYKLATEYVANLHKIIDEEMKTTNSPEESDDAEFNLMKKKEENLEVFKRFVDMVSEAQALDEDDDFQAEEAASSIVKKLDYEFMPSYPDSDISNPDYLDSDDTSFETEMSSEDLKKMDFDKAQQQLYDILTEAWDVNDGEIDWNHSQEELEKFEFEATMEKAREILDDIQKIEAQKIRKETTQDQMANNADEIEINSHDTEYFLNPIQQKLEKLEVEAEIENTMLPEFQKYDRVTNEQGISIANEEKEKKSKEDTSPSFS